MDLVRHAVESGHRQRLSLPSPPVHPLPSATPVWTGTELLKFSYNARLQAFHG